MLFHTASCVREKDKNNFELRERILWIVCVLLLLLCVCVFFQGYISCWCSTPDEWIIIRFNLFLLFQLGNVETKLNPVNRMTTQMQNSLENGKQRRENERVGELTMKRERRTREIIECDCKHIRLNIEMINLRKTINFHSLIKSLCARNKPMRGWLPLTRPYNYSNASKENCRFSAAQTQPAHITY